MKKASKRNPSDFTKYDQVYGHGGVRICRVSETEANKIVGELRSKVRYDPSDLTGGSLHLFYMNVNRGEQHFIFSLPVSSGTA